MAGADIVRRNDIRVSVATHWRVETARLVDPVEAVEAGFVEIKEARRYLDRRNRLLFADAIVIILIMFPGMCLETRKKRAWLLFD
jgi:hypothetical protein